MPLYYRDGLLVGSSDEKVFWGISCRKGFYTVSRVYFDMDHLEACGVDPNDLIALVFKNEKLAWENSFLAVHCSAERWTHGHISCGDCDNRRD